MTAPIALATFALLAATVGSRLLRRSRWPDRAPRLGIVAWQALSASVVVSVLLAGAALAVPRMPASTSLAGFLHTCAMALREQYDTPGGAVWSAAGVALALGVTGRVGWCVAAATWTARRTRAVQRRALALVALPHPLHDLLVVQHAAAAAYCMPGHDGAVVMTSAALDALNEEQTAAVLAHERAHLRARHHVVLAVAAGLRRAFPKVPVFSSAQTELSRLVEMHADDVAARHSRRAALATAVFRLAGGTAPTGTLGAGATAALARVRRLVDGPRPLGAAASALVGTVVTATVAAPMLIVAAPAMVAAAVDLCPLAFPAA